MDATLNRRTANLLLAVILLMTALVWIRACRITYVSDDYLLELHSFAPITSVRDVAKRFSAPAVNLRYWRPVPDGLAVGDFLVWKWDGRGFHLTNLIVHLLATFFAFLLVRDVFGRPSSQALAVTLLFGIAASHEANILWPPGRADSLATLFVFLTLILERHARRGRPRWWARTLGVACFVLALASKEVALVALLFLAVMPDDTRGVGRRTLRMLPYVAAAVLLLFYRSRFVEPMSSAPIFSGSHSPSVLATNALYSLGYAVLPLDLPQALGLLNDHRTLLVVLAASVCALVVLFSLHVITADKWRKYLIPLAYTAATGAFVVFSFERWRVYMMSVAVFTLLVMVALDVLAPLRIKTRRTVLVVGASGLILFNVFRAFSAEANWLRASELRRSLQTDLGRVLAEHAVRPVTFLFLDRPVKLGSAPLLQLAIRDVLSQAELERSDSPKLATGGMRDMTVDHESATFLLAFDEDRGFEGLRWRTAGRHTYDIWVEGNVGLAIAPAVAKTAGRSGRDQVYASGDTLRSAFADVVLIDTKRTFATRVTVVVRDTTTVPLIFDGERFILPEGEPTPPPLFEARGGSRPR
jgi:hypothetical protein